MLQIDQNGKTAIITGSTAGIGFAIAGRLADAGATVIVNGRSEGSVSKAVNALLAEGSQRNLKGIAADVTSADGAAHLAEQAGAVDILVNNLGIFGAAEPLEISDEEWLRYFEVYVLSAARLTRLLMPGMQDRGWGRILNIASDSATVIPAEMIHYGVSKTALLGVSRGFAKAAAGTGVTVNSVIAGPTHTPGVEDFVYQLVDKDKPWDEAQREFMKLHRPQSLFQRLIEPTEIANMVVYLSSDLASATTGGALRVDGGYVDSILP